ncbi:MAG: hypothetical protein Ct9H90mP22_9030 [Gammaproteobacteria bacterium]|nr:MAG: hypothetical protein Ct9H90mP22_9030 [Gammaproteobacteria bacterium]
MIFWFPINFFIGEKTSVSAVKTGYSKSLSFNKDLALWFLPFTINLEHSIGLLSIIEDSSKSCSQIYV